MQKLHVVYEMNEREDGKKEMIAAGTRMAAEKGMGPQRSKMVLRRVALPLDLIAITADPTHRRCRCP